MSEQRDGVTGDQPDELAGREDDLGTTVHGEAKVLESVADLDNERGPLEGLQVLTVGNVRVEETNEAPGDGSKDKEEGGHGRGQGVTEVQDQEGREEGTGGTGNLVKDVDSSIHALQLDHITSDNILGDDTANQLDHAVADTDNGVDGEENERIPLSVALDFVEGDLAAGGNVDDDDESREETEAEDGTGEDRFSGEAADQRGNGNGADTLEGLVETLENGQVPEGILRFEAVRGEQCNGACEGFLCDPICGGRQEGVSVVFFSCYCCYCCLCAFVVAVLRRELGYD